MIEATITTALDALGYADGWAANEVEGIVLWERDEPQPTEAELIAAGWIKPETTTPELPASDDDAGEPSSDAG